MTVLAPRRAAVIRSDFNVLAAALRLRAGGMQTTVFAEWMAAEWGFLCGLASFDDEPLELEPYQIDETSVSA